MDKAEAVAMTKTNDNDPTKSIEMHQLEKITIEKPATKHDAQSNLLYQIDDIPSWYMCILLGLQHYLTAFGSNLMAPLLMSSAAFCMKGDTLGISELIGTSFFVSGFCTLIQTVLGIRLPIMQGSSFSLITPAIALFSISPWKCPYSDPSYNGTIPVIGSEEHREIWQARLREFQGCLMIVSLVQMVIGFSGLLEVFLGLVGPLTTMPTITLIGLSLFEVASKNSSGNWYIAISVAALIAIFSQYLKNFNIPCFTYNRDRGFRKVSLPIFTMFPVLLAIAFVWLICFILTITNVLPNEKGSWGYSARTDINTDVIHASSWFNFPYPGQWGMPTVSVAGVLGLLAGIFCIIIESIGDYYACARLTGVPPPPVHGVNRGIALEGFTCFLAGAWGSASGSTSYSENIGAIAITKVGSRRVIQVGGLMMMFLGCLGKLGAVFVAIPTPLVGGVYLSLFGMVAAVGISNLRYVSLDSSRNLFIIGTSLFMGLVIPFWIQKNPGIIQTGSSLFDQTLSVLLGTNMFLGGFLGLFLDNTIPGTDEERGLISWRSQSDKDSTSANYDTYKLPNFIQKFLDKCLCLKYVPFCPAYNSYLTRAIPKLCSRMSPCCREKQENNNVLPGSDESKEDHEKESFIPDSKIV